MATPVPDPAGLPPGGAGIIARHQAATAGLIYRYAPVVFDRGEGSLLWDVEGQRYIDLAAGIATNSVGHAHPQVVAAITQQAGRLIHLAAHVGYYEPYVALAEKVLSLCPEPLQRGGQLFFLNSGSEAVEAAVKLARYVTGRKMALAFLGGFHGRAMGALALTASNSSYRRRYDALLAGVVHAPYPNPRRCPFGSLPPEACGEAALRYIDLLLKTVLPAEDLAAVVVEPIQGEGGYVVPPAGFLRGLRSLCDRTGALLVADEIQTGLGRTGRWFGMEHDGVAPDVMALAKPLGGGLPLAAVVARRDVMERWPVGAHGSTFGGNPVACAAGLATLRLIEQEGLVERAAGLGETARAQLRELAASRPAIGDVRGRGLMIGVELVQPDGSPAPEQLRRVLQAAVRHGVIVTRSGESTIRISPALNIPEPLLEDGLRRVMAAVDEVFA